MSRKRLAQEVKLGVVFEPDEDGWHVSVPSLKGCHTWGRSLVEARRNIREAISLFEEELGDADAVARDAVFEEDIRLPAQLRSAVRRFHTARAKSEAEAAKLRVASAAAARAITKRLSLRDAGELLGVSQEGVRKILKAG
jgi:predicted RNase H-like HicB family nuclease